MSKHCHLGQASASECLTRGFSSACMGLAIIHRYRKLTGVGLYPHDMIPKMTHSCHSCRRIKNLIEKSGNVVIGGQTDEKERFIAPTVLSNVKPSDPVMQDEVGGCILI